jgi:hypothetical protein
MIIWWLNFACQRTPSSPADPAATPPAPPPAPAPAPAPVPRSCPKSGLPTVSGVVSDPGLDELSGMAMSRRSDGAGKLWVHEDKHSSQVVSLDLAGSVQARRTMVGVDPTDTEDIATAIDPATQISWLFVGDIGDNRMVRDTIAVYLLEEPSPLEDGEIYPSVVELEYPDGAHDAEALLVDPMTLDLFVVTKVLSGQTVVFHKPAPHDAPGLHLLEPVATLSLEGGVTGGAFAPDGSALVLRTYLTTAWLWRRPPGSSVAQALMGEPCALSLPSEPQGEAVTFEPSGLRTVSEGVNSSLYFVPLAGL